jgi:hypothetical protein
MVLGVVWAVYVYGRLHRTGRWRYVIFLQGGVLVLSLSQLFALTIFGPLFILAGLDLLSSHQRQRSLQAGGALVGTGLVVFILLFVLGYGSALYHSSHEFGKAITQPEKFAAAAAEKPNRGAGPQVDPAFIQTQLLAPLGAGNTAPSLWLFNGLAGLGLFYLLGQKQYRLSLLLLLWLFIPVSAIVAFLVYRGTFFAPRYILFVLPAYLALVSAGLLALPRWLQSPLPSWLSQVTLLVLGGLVLIALISDLGQLYREPKKENWRLVSQFLAKNAQAEDAAIAVNAESTLNWYYPAAAAAVDTYDKLETIQQRVAHARRSWVIVSIFANYLGEEAFKIRAWLSEQGAIRMTFDPVIDVYYLGPHTTPPQLLQEIQGMALPVDHALYASLARENRRDPAVARRYYELAIEHAPDEENRAEYQADLEALTH